MLDTLPEPGHRQSWRSVAAEPGGHGLQTGYALCHRRVGRKEPRDILGTERVGDHHVTGVDEVTLGSEGRGGRSPLKLAQRGRECHRVAGELGAILGPGPST